MNDLCALLPEAPIQVFAAEESMALEYSRASLDNLEARIAALNALQGGEPAIVLTTSAGLRKRLTAVKKWQAAIWQLEVGAEVDFDQLDEQATGLIQVGKPEGQLGSSLKKTLKSCGWDEAQYAAVQVLLSLVLASVM